MSISKKKILLLTTVFIAAFYFTDAQVYTTQLSGSNEEPPNASPGTGSTTVTITGTLMRIQVSFTGLIGNTTVAHIHAPTALAGEGNAPAIISIPTLPGFPAGVTTGTYDITLNMEDPSRYSNAFITTNGGTAAAAFAAFKLAMDNGKAYFNIHSTFSPAGEIRGFFTKQCPVINVTIPDAYAMAQGVLPNMVYPGYTTASTLKLIANVSGGIAPYTYQWSEGSSTSDISVSPTVQTTYTVTVKDQNGCEGLASKTINVGIYDDNSNNKKVTICHKGKNTLIVNANAVAAHLAHGDVLGNCSNAKSSTIPGEKLAEQNNDRLSIKVLSNPSQNYFNLQLSGKAGSKVQIKVYDVLGRIIDTKPNLNSNQSLQIGSFYKPGIYLVEVIKGDEKQILRLLKVN